MEDNPSTDDIRAEQLTMGEDVKFSAALLHVADPGRSSSRISLRKVCDGF